MPFYFAMLKLFAVFQNFNSVAGHGRLLEPVSRASAWRKGYSSPPDYSDSQGFCGGFAVSSFQSFSYWNLNKICSLEEGIKERG